MTRQRRRNSLRLKGFDYSQPGDYFVTICTVDRRHVLGEVVDGRMRLSMIGEIVESCWRAIPDHFPDCRLDMFQLMPNHLHGIIQIMETTCRGEVSSPFPSSEVASPHPRGDETSPLRKITLGNMIAYFKYQATKQVNQIKGTPGEKLFQRNYYDHIIRDDMDHFFIRQYIDLNPIMWELDAENENAEPMTTESLRRRLQEDHGLTGIDLEMIIERELAYRDWTSKNCSEGFIIVVNEGSE